jgi:hypothetical protein
MVRECKDCHPSGSAESLMRSSCRMHICSDVRQHATENAGSGGFVQLPCKAGSQKAAHDLPLLGTWPCLQVVAQPIAQPILAPGMLAAQPVAYGIVPLVGVAAMAQPVVQAAPPPPPPPPPPPQPKVSKWPNFELDRRYARLSLHLGSVTE